MNANNSTKLGLRSLRYLLFKKPDLKGRQHEWALSGRTVGMALRSAAGQKQSPAARMSGGAESKD